MVKLNTFCLFILQQILAAPGWADAGQAWTAGGILEEVLLPITPSPEPKPGTPEHRAWAAAPVELNLTKRQQEVIIACIKHFAAGKSLPPVYALRPLLELAGLKPEGA